MPRLLVLVVCLYQPDAGDNEDITKDNIVAICSKKLNPCQQRYSTYKKELYGMVYCLRQHHPYCWGNKLVVITDHKPLTYILHSVQLAHALQQWLDVILDYHFTIKHRPGILHVVPDALSRLYEACYPSTWGVPAHDPYHIIETHQLGIDKDILVQMAQPPPLIDNKKSKSTPRVRASRTVHIAAVTSASASRGGDDMKITLRNNSAYDSDAESEDDNKHNDDASSSLQQDRSSVSPSISHVKMEIEPMLPPRTQDDDDYIMSVMEQRGKMSPSTQEQRQQVIDEEHARGHFGREAIFKALHRKNLWWPGIRRDIQARIRECIPCLRAVIAKTGFDPAMPISAALPWDHIQIDFIVELPESIEGYTAIMVIVDVCTGFILLRPTVRVSAEHVAPVLWQLFNDFGFPRVLQSDNGQEFTSHVLQEMVRLSGVDHRRITPYQPRTDGKVERNIKTVKQILKKHLHGVFTSWPAFVPWAQSSINNKITELTGSTPYSLMFGRRFNPYKDYSTDAPLETMSETDWARLQDQMISVVFPSIAERVAVQKDIMVNRMNKRQRAHNYRKGDVVMLRRHERVMGKEIGKFEDEYTGPYIIDSKNRTGAITLVNPLGVPLNRLVRPNQLKFVSRNTKHTNKTRLWWNR